MPLPARSARSAVMLATLLLGAPLLAGCGEAEQDVRDAVEREVTEQVDREVDRRRDDAGEQIERGRDAVRGAQEQLEREAGRLRDEANDLGIEP